MKANIENLDIWQLEDSLYCKRSDGHLLKIQSNHSDVLTKILRHISCTGTLTPPDDDGITQELFSQVVTFFLDNDIISTTETSKTDTRRTIGFVGNDDMFETLPSYLRCKDITLKYKKVSETSQLQGLHLLLVTAPVFDNYKLLEAISTASYRQGLPLLYSAFSPTTFTIGPLSFPPMDTPSLNCYIKRRAVNLKSPMEYAEFIKSEDKKHIETARITSFPYFEAGMNMLRCEIDRLLTHHGKLSYQLMGKSYTYDFTRFEVEESTVLKDPLSPLFTPGAPFTPFNG